MTKRENFVPPADRLLSDLDGTYYKLTEVGKLVGVSESRLRRLIRNTSVTAPSRQIWQGGMKVFLYSPEDVEEVREHFKNHIRVEDRHGAEGH